MTEKQRYSPLIILFDLFNLVKNYFFIFILLFVFRSDSESAIFFYGRVLFLIGLLISFIAIFLKWLTSKYEIDEHSFHLYKGVFSQSEQTIPLSKIQNINRHTSFFHRIIHMTSLNFETGVTNGESKVSFKVISIDEADRIEAYVETLKEAEEKTVTIENEHEVLIDTKNEEEFDLDEKQIVENKRTIHFEPTVKDTLRASLTSFSFLFLIPIILSLYLKVTDFFQVEDYTESLLAQIMNSWLIIAIILLLFIIISFSLGILRTYLKYGKYEITSDDYRIYIKRGIINETSFSIAKERVQAIEMNQTFIKRLLGLTEVKLTTAGALSLSNDGPEVNTLYPFLPVKEAANIIHEMLPTYQLTTEMNRLPKKAFWIKLLKPSWTWLTLSVLLTIFQPKMFNNEHSWWIIPIVLLVLIVSSRVLAYFNTKFIVNEQFIQMKTGGFSSKLFISKREKVTEISVSRNLFQRKLGLASITTINRGQPVHYESVSDILISDAVSFVEWYKNRSEEIQIE